MKPEDRAEIESWVALIVSIATMIFSVATFLKKFIS